MSISKKNIKPLWANSAGRCAFLACGKRLCGEETKEHAPYTIGEMAHIKGEKPTSNRYDAGQDATERNSYSNLILLCPNHHTLIDKNENEEKFPVDLLHEMKAQHEEFISKRLEVRVFENKYELASSLIPLLAENFQVWKSYGPLSDIARKSPHSNSAHAVWISERLSTIVPNNRLVRSMVEENIELFAPEEQSIVASFITHVKAYERWVEDEITYEAVERFPAAFDELIKELANAGRK